MTTSTTTLGAAFSERAVEADGFKVRYVEAGGGEPLVVLHAAGGLRFSIALDLLAAQFRVILLELPGFGEQSNDRHQTLGDMAATIDAATRALGLDRYRVLATSFSGAVAVYLALNFPERVVAMVLEAPAVFRAGATPPSLDVSLDDMRRAIRRHPERVPVWEPPDPAVMARTWPLLERLMGSAPDDEQFEALLSQCPVRTLVVFGDQDGLIPAQSGRNFRRVMPNCSYVLVHQAAHDIQADRPEAFAELVGDFLARGWAFLLPQESTLINP